MLKKIYIYLLLCSLVMTMLNLSVVELNAAEDTSLDDISFKYYPHATKLSEVGVFVGTGSGFELYRAPNRLEALVVMIRLIGAEDEAKAMANDPCPFTDVPEWGVGYVNYAYEKGLTVGVGNGLFGTKELITSNAFTTFMLRVLGYKDNNTDPLIPNDFVWSNANQFAFEKNILQNDLFNELVTDRFVRNHMASVSYATLTSLMKAPQITLNEHLVNSGKMDGNIDVFNLSTSGTGGTNGTDEVIDPENPADDELAIPKAELPLLGSALITPEQLKLWARSKGMPEEGIELVDIYYELSQVKGLNPVIQYAQMCYETGWLYKNKSAAGIDASYHNPCGLKTTVGGGDYDANAHMRFDTWRDGIDAHTDHSALYAGAPGYPKEITKDPRHFKWIFGRATTVEQLSGNWAPSPTYSLTILRLYNEAITFSN